MIEARLGGRLGNQMFQYSIARIIADKRKYNFYIPGIGSNPLPYEEDPSHHIHKYFPNIDMGIKDGNCTSNYQESSNQSYNPNIFNVSDYTRICGYYQTDKYYVGYEDQIKEWFRIEMDNDTKMLLDKYPIEDYCYVHLRAYVFGETDHLGRKTHTSEKYYRDAIDRIKKEKNDIKFLILTDDIRVAKNVLPEYEIISNEMMVDFKMLYYSKYCIMSCSSFSWWAAWLSDKYIAVGPENWINYDLPHLGCFPIDIKTNKFVYV
jgi:hypothetical protein